MGRCPKPHSLSWLPHTLQVLSELATKLLCGNKKVSKEIQGCACLARKTTRCGLKNLNSYFPTVSTQTADFF